jgi:hypothetical protein
LIGSRYERLLSPPSGDGRAYLERTDAESR